MTLANLNRFL